MTAAPHPTRRYLGTTAAYTAGSGAATIAVAIIATATGWGWLNPVGATLVGLTVVLAAITAILAIVVAARFIHGRHRIALDAARNARRDQ